MSGFLGSRIRRPNARTIASAPVDSSSQARGKPRSPAKKEGPTEREYVRSGGTLKKKDPLGPKANRNRGETPIQGRGRGKYKKKDLGGSEETIISGAGSSTRSEKEKLGNR